MDGIYEIIQDIPLFRHCTDSEYAYLKKIARIISIKSGQKLDIGKVNSLFVVISGLLEIEFPGKPDIAYLTRGSFFGDLPFSESKHRGSISALSESILLVFEIEDIYKFFLLSFKALRGYVRSLSSIGFDMSHAGADYLKSRSRVITVYSSSGGSGKSLLSACIGLSLARQSKTIILDTSYQGDSLFNIFEKKITPALSQKQVQETSQEFIYGRIEDVDERLSLLNICFGSKVKVDPEILSPILFLIAKKYEYIVFDLSEYDSELRDKVFELSDMIYAVFKRVKDRKALYGVIDSTVKEGQRVYYVLNQLFSPETPSLEGGLLFADLELDETRFFEHLQEKVRGGSIDDIVKTIRTKRRALVLESMLMESVAFAGLLKALEKNEVPIDLYYSSAMSYLVVSLYLLSSDLEEFEENIHRSFSETRWNSILEITFPEDNVFKHGKIHRFAGEIAGEKRIEFFESLPVVMLNGDSMQRRIFSTGSFRDLITASLLFSPVFESIEINGIAYSSGFPIRQVRAEEILRTDVDTVLFSSVRTKGILELSDRILNFFSRYLSSLYHIRVGKGSSTILTGNLILDLDERQFDIASIISASEEISQKLIKEKLSP